MLLLTPLTFILIFSCAYLYVDNKVYIRQGYENSIQTGAEIEANFLKHGTFETKKFTLKEESPIEKYTVYYPTELESKNRNYPMILIINGTGGKATKYEPQFELFASWGFIVVGTQDKNTGKWRI